MDAVETANSGHPGLPMGCADIATVLFTKIMKLDPRHPEWPDRDRFVLSAGHGSMLLYASLYLLGYEDATIEQLKTFRQLNSKTRGHPEYHFLKGIETTTGPLGQGIGNAVGMAVAQGQARRRVRQRHRRSSHLGAGRRRLPHGGDQPGGDLAGGPPQPQQAHPDLGQQRHHHRRQGEQCRQRPTRWHALRGLGLGHVQASRRPRPGRAASRR